MDACPNCRSTRKELEALRAEHESALRALASVRAQLATASRRALRHIVVDAANDAIKKALPGAHTVLKRVTLGVMK